MTKASTAIKKAPLDLSKLDTGKASDKGARIEIKDLDGSETGLFVTVLGKHSQVFREIVRDRVNQRVRDEANATRRNQNPEVMTAEQAEKAAIELLVACTLKWESETTLEDGTIEVKEFWPLEGEELSFNVQNGFRIYTQYLLIREQVDNAIGELENFIKT